MRSFVKSSSQKALKLDKVVKNNHLKILKTDEMHTTHGEAFIPEKSSESLVKQ